MRYPGPTLRGLLRDARGAMVIETALVLPTLLLLILGGFETSNMVSRHHELQLAAAEAAAATLAKIPKTAAERNTIESIIEASSGLEPGEVTLALEYRCGTAETMSDTSATCLSSDIVSEYIVITMTETYTPIWTNFGMGGPVDFNIERKVQIG